MLEEHELKALSDAVRDSWKDINFATVKRLDVHLRVVVDGAANFHTHADRDELFCCLEDVAHLDTDGATTTLQSHELVVVPRNTFQHFGVEGRAVVLVIEAIKG